MSNMPWPHAPTHALGQGGTYFVTAATLHHEHHFRGAERLRHLQRNLLSAAKDYGWSIEAWAVFSNHYHFVGHSPPGEIHAQSLRSLIRVIHVKTASEANRLDDREGRRVWFNYWESRMMRPTSYLARLNYVHHNAVRHGLVQVASHYPWCSAAWFERTATPAMVRTIYRFKTDLLREPDELKPAEDW